MKEKKIFQAYPYLITTESTIYIYIYIYDSNRTRNRKWVLPKKRKKLIRIYMLAINRTSLLHSIPLDVCQVCVKDVMVFSWQCHKLARTVTFYAVPLHKGKRILTYPQKYWTYYYQLVALFLEASPNFSVLLKILTLCDRMMDKTKSRKNAQTLSFWVFLSA